MIRGRALPSERDVLRLAHRVRVVHGGTALPLAAVDAELVAPAWPHWRMRQRGADVLVSLPQGFWDARPATTLLAVAIQEPGRRARFQAAGRAQVTLRRDQDADVTLPLVPAAMSLDVRLLRQNGQPRTGRTVEARANGLAIPLPEIGTSGVYRSASRVWEPAFRPCRIYVDNTQRGQTALDFEQAVTRVRLIVP